MRGEACPRRACPHSISRFSQCCSGACGFGTRRQLLPTQGHSHGYNYAHHALLGVLTGVAAAVQAQQNGALVAGSVHLERPPVPPPVPEV